MTIQRPYKIREVVKNGAVKLSTLDNNPIRDPVNGSKLKVYKERNKLVIGINMLGYATKGNWTIGQSKEVDEDPVVKKSPTIEMKIGQSLLQPWRRGLCQSGWKVLRFPGPTST